MRGLVWLLYFGLLAAEQPSKITESERSRLLEAQLKVVVLERDIEILRSRFVQLQAELDRARPAYDSLLQELRTKYTKQGYELTQDGSLRKIEVETKK